MGKKLELFREFYDFEELEDYKASLRSKERRIKSSQVEILGENLVFRDLNGKIIETRGFDEYQPIQISENRDYILLQKYEDEKIIVELRNFKEDRIWKKQMGGFYYAYISNDGNCSVFFKGYGSGRSRVVNEAEFYDKNGERLNRFSFEGGVSSDHQVFSNKSQLLIIWTIPIKILEDGSRELSGTACIYAFDFTGKEIWDFPIKEQGIHDLKISNDGKKIIAVGEGEGEVISGKLQGVGRIYFIDEQGKLVNEMPFNYGCTRAGIKFSDDTEHTVVFADQNVFLFEEDTGKLLWEYVDPNIFFEFIDISSKSKDVVVGGYDEQMNFYIIMISQDGGKIIDEKIEIPEEIEKVEISDNGDKIFLELSNKVIVFNVT